MTPGNNINNNIQLILNLTSIYDDNYFYHHHFVKGILQFLQLIFENEYYHLNAENSSIYFHHLMSQNFILIIGHLLFIH